MGAKIKVAIAGINGRMGRASAHAILAADNMQLIGACGKAGADYIGSDIGKLLSLPPSGAIIHNGVQETIAAASPDVLLEFTPAESAFENAKLAITNGVHCVIGTSGLSELQITELSKLSAQSRIGSMIVPNFSVGAVMMMEFARQAGSHFSNVEIVEMHHTQKIDAPSGTALHTAAKLKSTGTTYNTKETKEKELVAGARGGDCGAGIRVHSLRLPGLISHQEVIFGSPGELLTIRHDSYNTECFIPGILMCITAVMSMKNLTIGLESLLMNGKEN